MAPATASPTAEAAHWGGRVSLTPRILAVNVIAMLLLAGGFFYLDSFRSRIIDSRVTQARRETRLLADALGATPAERRAELLRRFATDTGARLTLLDGRGEVALDSREIGVANFALVDPSSDGLDQRAARWLDGVIDTIVFARRAPAYPTFMAPPGADQRDVDAVRGGRRDAATVWRAPDRTPVITAAARISDGGVLASAVNARDITQRVRVERTRLSVVVAMVAAISVALSLFLARTIVNPLRRLARAAVRVRLGRAREVVVPRLPERRDEIGMLARALSDMSLALRARIDATESFAADVTHELKNPLASLRSAVDGLERVDDPSLRAQLLAIVRDDVRRLDRLISDISEASRLDAQLSRAKFEAVDVGAMLRALVDQRMQRGSARGVNLRLSPGGERLIAWGEGARLERVFENLIDNAVSFSPANAAVAITARRDIDMLEVCVADEGPGVPEEARDAIFRRFHSVRPRAEAFGQHSGLGLAIARTIVEGHQGTIAVEPRSDGAGGACFVVRLPLADARGSA